MRGIHGSVDSSDSIIPVKACLVLSKEGLVFLDFAYAFDLSDIRKADALPKSAIQAIAREDLKNNPYASDSEEFEMRLMNLCIRHGTGTKASYERFAPYGAFRRQEREISTSAWLFTMRFRENGYLRGCFNRKK